MLINYDSTQYFIFYRLLHLGGPDGELAASMRYLNQRYAAPYGEIKGLLTDIGVSVSKLRIFIRHTFEKLY